MVVVVHGLDRRRCSPTARHRKKITSIADSLIRRHHDPDSRQRMARQLSRAERTPVFSHSNAPNQSCIDQLSLAEADGGSLMYRIVGTHAGHDECAPVRPAATRARPCAPFKDSCRAFQALEYGNRHWPDGVPKCYSGPVPWTANPPLASAGRPSGSSSPSTRRCGANSFTSTISWTMPSNNGELGVQLCAGTAVPQKTDAADCELWKTRNADLKRSFAAGASVDCDSIFIRPNDTLLQNTMSLSCAILKSLFSCRRKSWELPGRCYCGCCLRRICLL
jgi:hypothetical protein